MKYTVDIIDTEDDSHVTALEYAQARSLVLRWNGSDTKDGQFIVGSSFSFTMEVNVANAADGYFRHLFTGNETKYKVIIYLTDTPSDIVWSGFLLPDSYTEPYAQGTFYPSFQAVDGLGRLKGKYLLDEYYEKEFSVVEYIAECFRLTGLQLPFHISPAIENVTVKNYNAIYLNGIDFFDREKKMDAYAILQDILESMVCMVYQSDNQWWVEGINKRHLQTISFYNYEFSGEYIDTTKNTKLLKNFNGIDTPIISVVPAYNEIYCTHERVAQQLPETIAEEENENWAVGQGISGDIQPTHWFGANGYNAKALSPTYKVSLPTKLGTAFDTTKYVSLKKKIYVRQYDKLVFSAKFKSSVSALKDDVVTPNGIRISFKLNGTVIYSVDRIFEESAIEIDFDIFINTAGLLDVVLYEPFFSGTIEAGTYASYIDLEKLQMVVNGFDNTMIVVDTINDDFTVDKEVEVPIADDATGFSRAFRLEKLNENSYFYNVSEVPVLYGFTQNGMYYSVVSLYGANLISDNIDTVYYDAVLLTGLEVNYNHQNGEQMVVRTATAITTGSFFVREYAIQDVNGSRVHWEQWTDAIYPIESDRYLESVAKIYRRLFINAHERVEYTADDAYKINDLIRFNYYIPSNYFITDLAWNLDHGRSDITMIKCVYQNEVVDIGGGENVPPLVNAGNDTVLASDFGTFDPVFGYLTLLHNTASAFDPDGFIVTYFWEIESGDANAVINGRNQLVPTLVRFNGQELVLRLTVKDNDGATAFDTVKFTKQTQVAFNLNEDLYYNTGGEESSGLAYKRDLVEFVPALDDTVVLTIKGIYYLKHIDPFRLDGATYNGVTTFIVEKNGVIIIQDSLEGKVVNKVGDFEFNYINGDVIKITVQCFAPFVAFASSDYIDLRAGYEVNNMIFQNGGGEITGYPVTKEVRYIGRT